ncbi:fic family toxin-antitoxin system, toxin component [Streptomyces sp. NPDC002187]|uniref:fic family toxin-antitoxin system, toxin component n=1 Tax=Streptomyces sp. NPDC002187 TaxID=3364637 RepID=UPI003697FC35
MTRHLAPQELLQIAQTLPGDPACLDLGVLDAACARTSARYMDQDVYGSTWLKAAALLQTLALHDPLEDRNAFFAWLAGEVFLEANGIRMNYEPEEALALVMSAGHKNASVQEIAAQLRGWTITS